MDARGAQPPSPPDDDVAQGERTRPAAVRRRVATALAALLVAALLAAGLLLAARSDRPPPATRTAFAPVPGTHCAQQRLRYFATDDPAVRDQQTRFEHDVDARPVPEPGVYRAPLDPVASLHAVLHGSVVVYLRTASARAGFAALAPLTRRARSLYVPLVVSPRRQAPALTAIRAGVELRCTATEGGDVEAVRTFAAEQFPALDG